MVVVLPVPARARTTMCCCPLSTSSKIARCSSVQFGIAPPSFLLRTSLPCKPLPRRKRGLHQRPRPVFLGLPIHPRELRECFVRRKPHCPVLPHDPQRIAHRASPATMPRVAMIFFA